VVGLLLASGRGRRFDPSGQRNKLLAVLADGRPVLRAAAEHLCAALSEVAIVLPFEDTTLPTCVEGLEITIVRNPRAAEGMSHSIAVGVSRFPHARGWMVALGDMPYINYLSIRTVAGALSSTDTIVAPVYGGRRGHPVAFGASHFLELCELSGDHGARALLAQHPVKEVPLEDPGILRDIDTPWDFS